MDYRLAMLFIIYGTFFLTSCHEKEQGSRMWNGMEVPDGFTINPAVDSNLIAYPMFASFDNDGRLFICESTGETFSTEEMLKRPPYHIRLLEDTDGDGIFDKSTIFADSITYPMGAAFYHGSLYVAAAPDLLKFTDSDGDGVADKREVILTGWTLNHNAATFGGPYIGPDGWLYLTDARRGYEIKTKEGKILSGKGARIWRCRPDGTGLEALCGGGFDNSIELIFMDAGETIGTMTYFTDPQNGYRDALMHWVYGGVYPKPQPVIEEDHLKLTGGLMPVMTKLARVAHAGLMRYEGASFGQDFEGNLFAAQFNTGRIMRYVITPDGGTFRTKEEVFMASANQDVHPTDVLEAADGSLLVVNTGGWFIAGCPLSVVAKTNIKGGIYRIRKTGAPHIEDPWGKKLNFSRMSPEKLARYVTDPRFPVRSKAVEELVIRGSSMVTPIIKNLLSGENEKARTEAVFMLYRIGTPSALKAVRSALEDSSVIVRTAAARVLGMAKDSSAVDKLMTMVQSDQARVRRQAATALGQIGDDHAVGALLKAAADPDDRFVEHAIIYALITLNDPGPLIQTLGSASAKEQKAALIALDQMDASPLTRNEVARFLNSDDTLLQYTGIWVASHHPGWGDIVVDFLKKYFSQKEAPKVDSMAIDNLMVTFSTDKQVQSFIGNRLAGENTSPSRKLFFIHVINHSQVTRMPSNWITPLEKLLHGGDPVLRTEVLGLITAKSDPKLNKELEQIMQDEKAPAGFRLKALGARIVSRPQLSEKEFRFLLKCLDSNNISPVRQSAAQLIGQAKLDDSQLLVLAHQQIPQIDVFLLPDLVKTFENSGTNHEEVGEALAGALQSSPDRMDNLSLTEVRKLFAAFPSSVQSSAKPLIDKLEKKQASRLKRLQQIQAGLKRGDIAAGRKLFYGKATCFTCHSVAGKGGTLGPDLTNIGAIRSEHDILEAILYPSASFAREHETSKIVTKTNSYTGIIKEQLPNAIIIQTGPQTKVQVPQSAITSIEPQDVSMMPNGLDKILTTEELSDLIAYLTSLPDGLGQKRSF
jgi:putative membrane-bound dehydrogenase-like protein